MQEPITESIDLYSLWQIYRLVQQIELALVDRYLHLRLWTDGSGGLYELIRKKAWLEIEYIELVEWNDLADGVAVLTKYLEKVQCKSN